MSCCPCLRRGSKKMLSNIFHLPLFISILCWMSLTACKLIYNAVCSWAGWRTGESDRRLGVWVLYMMWWQQWKPILWRANLIGAIFIPGFLDFREERFGLLLVSVSLWQPRSRALGEWRNDTSVCLVGGWVLPLKLPSSLIAARCVLPFSVTFKLKMKCGEIFN